MQIRTLCAAAALLAAPCAVMAQAYLDNTTVGNIATAQVGNTSGSTTSAYLDIEGTANGKTGSPGFYETYGLIDFGSIYFAPNQRLQGNTLDLNLSDTPFGATVPGSISIALVTSPVLNLAAVLKANPGALKYANPPASINLPITASYYAFPGSLNYNLLGPGNNYTSTPGTPAGGNYDYTVMLPTAAVNYFNTVLSDSNNPSTDPNADLQLLVTASTPGVVGSFYGGAFPSATSPYIGFNAVPEPSAVMSLLMGISAVGLLAARRRQQR
jgi:hypothetical protein